MIRGKGFRIAVVVLLVVVYLVLSKIVAMRQETRHALTGTGGAAAISGRFYAA